MDERADSVTRAVDLLTGRSLRDPLTAQPFTDPLLDATSVAAADINRTVNPPDPGVESDFRPDSAVLAASGIFGWRLRLRRNWNSKTVDPVVQESPGGFDALLPSRRARVAAIDRTVRALGSADAGSGLALVPDVPTCTSWWRLMLWGLARRRRDVVWLLVLGVLGGVAGLLLPLATGAVFESAIPSGDTARIFFILIAFGVGSAAAAVIGMARGLYVVRIRDAADSRLSPALLSRMLRLRTSFFHGRPNGEMVNRALSIEAARQQVDDNTVAILITSVFGLVNLVYLIAADIAVGLVTAGIVAVVLVISIRLQIRARRLLPALLDARSRSDSTLLTVLGSLVSWRVAGAEGRALARWANDQRSSTQALTERLRALSAISPVDAAAPTAVLAAFTAAVILLPGANLEPGSNSAPGVFLAMYAAVAQLSIAVVALTGQAVLLSELGPTLNRANPILTEPLEQEQPGLRPGRLDGSLALSDVVFGYRHDRVPLFDGLNLSVTAGEFVAVVGPSGSGKSTILRLLLGFETPWQGTVTYDGQDLTGLDLPSVRRQLGVVLQSSQPLGTTIRDSVCGPRSLSDERVWDLLGDAGLADDVRAMPDLLDTPIGNRGLAISGGQRQRLAIASALSGDPPILLFDEATSALDNITQSVVMRTVLASRATRFVIAHRMSTIRNADRVLVVANGIIAEEGTPDALLATGGHFSKLAARQEL